MSEKRYVVSLQVNGIKRQAEVVARVTLVDLLRDELGLTGTHVGCEHGVCGACSVQLDGQPVRSCCMFAVQADGCSVTTVEGLASEQDQLSVLQDAFCEAHGLQCGYCTSGMLIAAQSLLEKNADPREAEIRDAISGNLCRCTGYQQIVDSIELAATRLRAAK